MVQRYAVTIKVDSAVKSDMNSNVTRTRNTLSLNEVFRSNIKSLSFNLHMQLESREGGSDDKIVEDIEVRNENSLFSGSNSGAKFDPNLTLQSLNIREVDEIPRVVSEGYREFDRIILKQ